jgi:hypothetical protein
MTAHRVLPRMEDTSASHGQTVGSALSGYVTGRLAHPAQRPADLTLGAARRRGSYFAPKKSAR